MLNLPERDDEPGLERRPTRGRFYIDRHAGYNSMSCRSRTGVWRWEHERDRDGVCLFCDDGKNESDSDDSATLLWDPCDDLDWGWDVQLLDFGELSGIE